LYSLTYDIWNAIIDEAIDAYSPLFEVMQRAADGIILSKSLVDKLKQEGFMDLGAKIGSSCSLSSSTMT
jgi:hypothetical protein